ncbi:MAG: DUF72 domain-containing protein [Myxococcota bacterium]
MDFGAVDDARGIDFSLPPLDPACLARWLVVSAPSEHRLAVHSGAPMWGEKAWVGPLYPEGLPPRAWLGHYAARLGAVEHNGTFYAIPTPELVAGWAAVTPPTFRFCVKVPKTISHAGPWREDAPRFGAAVRTFGERLGPVLFQVPPEVGPAHLPEIIARITALGPDLPVAVEVRHPDFFREGRLAPALVEWMARTDRIAVVTDTPGRRDVAHASLPSPRLYLRFLACEGPDDARVADWADRIAAWTDLGLREAWVFVHQRDVVGLLTRVEALHRALTTRLEGRLVAPLPTRLLRPPPLGLFGPRS